MTQAPNDTYKYWFMVNHVNVQQLDQLDENLITRARAKNNMREVDGAMAKELAEQAIRMCQS